MGESKLHSSYPEGVWDPSATALVVAAALAPPAVVWCLDSSSHGWVAVAAVFQLVATSFCLVAAALIYFQYRLRRTPALGWVAMCMTAYGMNGVTIALILAIESGRYPRPGWALVLDLGIAAVVGALTWLAQGHTLRGDPLALGIVAGLALGVLHLELQTNGPVIGTVVPTVLLGVAVVGLWTWAAVRVMRYPGELAPWMVRRLGLGAVAIAISRVASAHLSESQVVTSVVVILAGVVGGVLMLTASLAGLRYEIQRHEDRLETLDKRVAAMEALQREQRSRLHEITNALAGIAGASELMHHNHRLPESRRHRLEEMLDHEAARLARILEKQSLAADPGVAGDLVAGRGPSAQLTAQVVDLDSLLRTLTSAQDAVGRRVRWEPSGLKALGDRDAVAEVLSVLLDNARKHAPGATTTVTARRTERCVEVIVSDDGPGVPPLWREHVFTWGHRGPASRGHGIGLHLARRRAQECGGSLELVPGAGARFVLRLRAASSRDSGSAGIWDAS